MAKLAILDIGSNSSKILIFDPTLPESDREYLSKRITSPLGVSVHLTNSIDSTATTRAIDVIHQLITYADSHGVLIDNMYAYATAAVRNASNQHDFIQTVLSETSLRSIKVLSKEEETQCTYLGAIYEAICQEISSLYFVIDIGGGSFQLALGNNHKVLSGISVQRSCQALTTNFRLDKPTTTGNIADVYDALSTISLPFNVLPDNPLCIMTGGTGRLVYLLKREKKMDSQFIGDLIDHLFPLTVEERLNFFISQISPQDCLQYGIDYERSRIALAGFIILNFLVQKYSIGMIHSSETDIRHGYCLHYVLKNY